MKRLLLFVFVVLQINCGPSDTDQKELQKTNFKTLEIKILNNSTNGRYSEASDLIKTYKNEYPEFSNKLDSINIEIEKEKAEKLKRIDDAKKRLSSLRHDTDEFKGMTFYTHQTSPKYTNEKGFYAYFSVDENGTPIALRLRVQYFGDDWLFVENCQILVDGEKFTYIPGQFERDNEAGKVWEYNDSIVDEETKEILEAIANGKEAKIRFNGDKYFFDQTLSNRQKKALRDVIDIWDGLSIVVK